jgi:hypothetical protein
MSKVARPMQQEGPKILLLDIETFPNLYYAWRLWEGRALDIKKFSNIVCFSVKWLGGQQITKALPDFGGSEAKLTKELWKLVNDADILVAHNGRAFDFGRMNSQFLRHGLNPPSPAQKVDTKRAAKEAFGFDSVSLDNLCAYLGLGEKMETGGYDLWRKCMENDPKAWARMKKYNAHDVVLLEKLYLKLRPWMPKHPNVTLFTGDCPKCGSLNIQKRGTYRSTTREYQRYQCMNCGGWCKGTKSTGKTRITNTNV